MFRYGAVIVGFLGVLLIYGCATTPVNCELLSHGTSEYRHCRADEGSKEYQFRVGMEAFVYRDYEKARKYFKHAAREISSRNQISVPSYHNDNPLERTNIERRNEEEKGHKGAHFMLAEMYKKGIGVAMNDRLAAKHIEKSVNRQINIEEQFSRYIIKTMAKIAFSSDPDKVGELFEYSTFNIMKKNDPRL